MQLLVDLVVDGARPLVEALGEPEGDLLVGRLDGVRAVDDVAANLDAEVTADGAGGGLGGVGGTDDDTAGLHDTLQGKVQAANMVRKDSHQRDEVAVSRLQWEVVTICIGAPLGVPMRHSGYRYTK